MRRRAPYRVALAGALLLLARSWADAVQVGTVVPDFGMPTLEGRRFSLAAAKKTHSGVVVLFLSTSCPYSNYYNDLIRDLAAEFEKRSVLFVGVNSGRGEALEDVRAHAREHGHTFYIIKDPESRIAELFDARYAPEAFLVDSTGMLRYHGRIASKISSPDLKSAIEALLGGLPVRPAETRAYGCAIPKR